MGKSLCHFGIKKDASQHLLHSDIYSGFSGQKSFEEQLRTLAISFRWTILYFAFLEGASI